MAQPAPTPLVDRDLAASFALTVVELLQAEPSPAQVQAAARSAFHWAAYCVDLLEAAQPLPQAPACRVGCDSCCFNQVELTAPEALLLGSFLTETLAADRLGQLRGQVADSWRRRAGLSKTQFTAIRAELPCPLLENGACLAYEVRPLMCRAMHSLDAAACRQELAAPDLNLVQFYSHRHVIHVSLSQGLIDACRALGLQAGPVDLCHSLQICVENSELTNRWLQGQPVFQLSDKEVT